MKTILLATLRLASLVGVLRRGSYYGGKKSVTPLKNRKTRVSALAQKPIDSVISPLLIVISL